MVENSENKDTGEMNSTDKPKSQADEIKPNNNESLDSDGVVKKSDEYRELEDRYLRLAAEFDNYKKRMAKEYSRVLETSADDTIRDLLVVVDDFERALAHENSDANSLRQGINLIYTKMSDIMKKRGLIPIKGKGEQFDPIYHHAVMQLETEEQEEGTIIEEVQKGYTINGRVLRPAQVVVAKGKTTASALPTGENSESK
jgi:molecular chaperone GrpE